MGKFKNNLKFTEEEIKIFKDNNINEPDGLSDLPYYSGRYSEEKEEIIRVLILKSQARNHNEIYSNMNKSGETYLRCSSSTTGFHFFNKEFGDFFVLIVVYILVKMRLKDVGNITRTTLLRS